MQHFAQFSSSDDEAEKKEGSSGLRDAAIGGLEGALGFAVTEPLVHKIQNSRLGKGFLGTKAGKVAVSAGTGALGTLAVGAGLNAVGGLLKKKSNPQLEDQYNTQTQYNYQGVHFADFALTAEQQATADSLNYLRQKDREGFQNAKNELGEAAKRNKKQIQNQLDAQTLNKTNEYIGYGLDPDNARAEALKNTQANRGNVVKTAQKNYNKNFVQPTSANQAAGNLGKIGNTAKRWGGKVAGLGGLAMTGMYVLPQIASLLPSGQKPQPEQEPPY